MKAKKYIMLIGRDLMEEREPYTIIYNVNTYELSSLTAILLKKDIEILIRPQED